MARQKFLPSWNTCTGGECRLLFHAPQIFLTGNLRLAFMASYCFRTYSPLVEKVNISLS